MLSRVANSLYWMSRYIERAENIARIVDVNLQLLLDFRDLNERRLAEHWLPVIQTTGDEALFFASNKKATAQSVTEFLGFQMENPNSLVSAICQARENARMVRDQITVELWEELNRLYWFEDFPRSARFCVAELNNALRHISGVALGRFCNEAEKLAGRFTADLQFTAIDDVFETGLHEYLDQLQGQLNAIGNALFNAYVVQPFHDLDDLAMVQQEEQQQQFGCPESKG
jgi:uncharacterized alpha-E superfamily protein